MQKLIIFLAAFGLFLPAISRANESYFSLETGAIFPAKTTAQNVTTEYKTGYAVGGTFGVKPGTNLRIETEIIYRNAEAKTGGDLWSFAWLVNAWYDIPTSSNLTPYFGGGIGFARGHVASLNNVDLTSSGVAYQAGAGVDYRISRKVSLDVGYRYFGVSDTGTNNSDFGSIDQAGSSVLASAKWRF